VEPNPDSSGNGSTDTQNPGSTGDGSTNEDRTETGAQNETASPPSTPGNPQASLSNIGLKLTWGTSSNNPSEYVIYYSSDGKLYERIGTTPTAQFELITISPAGWYRVTALNKAGESSPTSAVQVKNP
jgi:penicillin-binding protein